MKRAVASLALMTILAPGSRAQAPNGALRAMAEAQVRGGAVPGMVIGTISGSEVRVEGFGALSKGRAGRPDADTVYEIGSLTKTFTALLLADAVARGTLKLDDPVATLLPGYRIPALGERQVTLLDLATQTSGLPRLPGNMAPASKENPYADYSDARLKAFLGSHALVRAPGARYDYSNLGFGLLGTALAAHAGKDYATLLGERITGPLGMRSTALALNDDLRARLAPGHDAAGKPVVNWDFDSLAGAGAIRSTAPDMLRYLRAMMNPASAGALPGLRLVQQPQRPTGSSGGQIALAWQIRQMGEFTVAWHNGMTGGYASFMAFTTDGTRGVVVLANGASSVNEVGFAALLPQLVAAPAKPLAKELLDQYVGRYRLAPGMVLTIGAADGALSAHATGQGAAALYPLKTDEFELRVVEARLQFQRGADGKVASVVLHQGGRAMPAPRIGADEPLIVQPTEITLPAGMLREYAGRYVLPMFTVVVTQEDGRLFIQPSGQGRSEVFASKHDEVFSKMVDAQMTFKRDARGVVNTMVLHQGGQHISGLKTQK